MLFDNCLYIKVCVGARIRGEKIYAGTIFCTNIKKWQMQAVTIL